MTTHLFDEIFTMTDTLTTAPVAPLLARLFAEADEAAIGLNAMAAALPPGELARLMRSNPGPERLPGPDQVGRPLRPRCRDHQKQHNRALLMRRSDRNAAEGSSNA